MILDMLLWRLWDLLNYHIVCGAVYELSAPVAIFFSGSDVFEYNSKKSSTGGMIPGRFTFTVLLNEHFETLFHYQTLSFPLIILFGVSV